MKKEELSGQETKKCRKCGETKDIECFHINRRSIGGRLHVCGKCANSTRKKRSNKNRYANRLPEKHYFTAKTRCLTKGTSYNLRGIPFDLTKEDVIEAWFRDKAYLLKRPSIDRIIGRLGYVKENIRFIELTDNVWRKKTP